MTEWRWRRMEDQNRRLLKPRTPKGEGKSLISLARMDRAEKSRISKLGEMRGVGPTKNNTGKKDKLETT